MARNEDQHFVPQFFLRRFSIDGASIGAFVAPAKFIDCASIKGQAHRRFMYGRDLKLEQLLSEQEGHWSALLRETDQHDLPPAALSPAHRDLLYFMAIQRGRTTSAAADHEDALVQMERFKLRAYAEIGVALPEAPDLPANQHVLRALDTHLRGWPYLLDLQPIVVRNDTEEWFITSDAPVCFHNVALHDLEKGGANAYSSPGLIVFLPISQRRGLLFFDRNMYCPTDGMDIQSADADRSDVCALNALTSANAERTLYYSPAQPHAQISEAFKRGVNARPKSRSVTHEVKVPEGDGHRRVLAYSPSCAQLSMNLSFLSVLSKRAKRIRAILAVRPFPRHPELHCWLDKHAKVAGHGSPKALLRDMEAGYSELYANLLTPGHAFIGPIAEGRIPGIDRNIIKAFSR